MASLNIAKAIFPVAVAGSAGLTAGASNGLTADPKEVIVGNDTTYIDLDLGSSQSADTFLAGFLSATDFALLTLYSGATFQSRTTNQGNFLIPPITAARRHAFLKLAAPI